MTVRGRISDPTGPAGCGQAGIVSVLFRGRMML